MTITVINTTNITHHHHYYTNTTTNYCCYYYHYYHYCYCYYYYYNTGYISEKSCRLLVSACSVALATAIKAQTTSSTTSTANDSILVMSSLLAPLVVSSIMIIETTDAERWLQSILVCHPDHHHQQQQHVSTLMYVSSILSNNCALCYLLVAYKDAIVEAHKCYSTSNTATATTSLSLVETFTLPLLDASINRLSVTIDDDEYEAVCQILSSSVSFLVPTTTNNVLTVLADMAIKLVTLAANSGNSNVMKYSINATSSIIKTIKLFILHAYATTAIITNAIITTTTNDDPLLQMLVKIFSTVSTISIGVIGSSATCDDTFVNIIGTTTTTITTTTTTTTSTATTTTTTTTTTTITTTTTTTITTTTTTTIIIIIITTDTNTNTARAYGRVLDSDTIM